MVISNLCSFCQQIKDLGSESEPCHISKGEGVRTYFEVVQELSECHLLAAWLQPCDFESIPQRPLDFVVLQHIEEPNLKHVFGAAGLKLPNATYFSSAHAENVSVRR